MLDARADLEPEPGRETGPDAGAVLVVDSDEGDGARLAAIFGGAGYATCLVATAEDALAFARERPPAAVVLEVALDGGSGYDVCRALREEHGEDLPIVLVSGTRTEPSDRVRGFLDGADDYIVKPLDADEIIARLRRLMRRSARRTDDAGDPTMFAELTRRESEVLRLLASGLDQETIARDLAISPATVGTHIQRILTKLHVHSRAQAVALAYRERLVEQR